LDLTITINRRIEDKKNKIISKVEMMSLQVISVLASSSAVFVVLSETTFFRGNTEEVSGVGYIQYDSGFLKFSLLHASHQGLSWGGEVNN
jgi:hypothetical protein